MAQLPFYIPAVFILTTFLTVFFLFKATHYSKPVAYLAALWLLIQGTVGFAGFYQVEDTIPPRFVLLVGPALLAIILLFTFRPGRRFIDALDHKWLVWLHIVRVPVEIVLFWLFVQRLVPKDMTFEGTNLDILSGLTAPFFAFFGYHRRKLGRWALVAWNLACLILLFNVVSTAVLSAPTPIQSRAFDQPNVGVLYFPFVWLPGFIVPVVFFSHLVLLRRLMLSGPNETKVLSLT